MLLACYFSNQHIVASRVSLRRASFSFVMMSSQLEEDLIRVSLTATHQRELLDNFFIFNYGRCIYTKGRTIQ